MTEPLIRVRNLEKFYGSARALHVSALDIADGGQVLVTGPNGSGKSTLMRLLAGVGKPTRGSITIDAALATAPLGYVPQSGGLHADASVRENLTRRLRLFGARFGTPEHQEVLDAIGLLEFMDTRVTELSVGYQRLTVITAAMLVRPQWLLWDEPFAGVDATRTAAVTRTLSSLLRPRAFVLAAPEATEIPGITFSHTLSLTRSQEPCAQP